MFGEYNEKAQTLIELLKKANDQYLRALNARGHEPDSDIAYDIERGIGTAKGTHASMGRDPSTKAEFEKVRFGREWPSEKWYQHKGFPKWHPAELQTMGIQKPPITRKNMFFPGVKESP